MQIFIVTAGIHYEGLRAQWVFADEASARAKYESFLDAKKLARLGADYVALTGPFAPGADVLADVGKELAHYDPKAEAEAARRAAYNEKRKAARRAAKAGKPTDGYAAMRMEDGG
jgi:hypothetical protein